MTGNAPSFAKLLLRIFLPFAFAYFLSYIFRGVNAAKDVGEEIGEGERQEDPQQQLRERWGVSGHVSFGALARLESYHELFFQLKVISRGVKVGSGSSGLPGAGHVPSFRCFSIVGRSCCITTQPCTRTPG